jgi:hypothetical protein
MQIICTEKNLDGSFSMFSMEEFIHIVMLHPIEVLHEAFSYERYTMGDVGRNYSAGEAIKEKLLPTLIITVSFMKDMIKLKN